MTRNISTRHLIHQRTIYIRGKKGNKSLLSRQQLKNGANKRQQNQCQIQEKQWVGADF
jgi:hypothetical protein